jgi:hypothetical protein
LAFFALRQYHVGRGRAKRRRGNVINAATYINGTHQRRGTPRPTLTAQGHAAACIAM